jgi:hypothetical protein
MTPLDLPTEPSFECGDEDSRDFAFVHATGLIGGRDAVEEYLACDMFPLSVSFSFTDIGDGETLVSMVTMSLPVFPLAKLQVESDDHFLTRVELGAENVVDSYGRTEHDACVQVLPNTGRLNRVFRWLVWPMVPVRISAPRPTQRLLRKEKVMPTSGWWENG